MKKILYKFGFFLIFSAILSLSFTGEARANYLYYDADTNLANLDSGLKVSGDYYGNTYHAYGSNPFYFQDYGGGWFMSDGSWVRTYNGKSVWTADGLLGTNGGLTVGYGGTTPPGGGAIIAGNVGIGTTDPGSYKLNVNGDAKFLQNVYVGGAKMLTEDGTGILKFGLAGGNQTALYSASAEAIRINTSGNVGIGTTIPTDKLYVSGNTTISGIAGCSGTGYAIKTDSSGRLVCGTISGGITGSGTANYVARWTGAETLGTGTLYDDGTNVGVGLTNPATKFWVQGASTFTSPTAGSSVIDYSTIGLQIGPSTPRTATANLYSSGIAFNHLLNYGGTGTNVYFTHPQAWIGLRLQDTPGSERSNLVFATKDTTDNGTSDIPVERMTITPAGNVGIGSTVPSAALDVFGKLRFTSGGTIYSADSSRWLDLSGALGDSLRVSGAIRMGSGLYNSNGNQVIEGNASDWLRIAAGGGYTNGTAAYGNWAFGQGGVSIGSWLGNIPSGNLYVSNNVGIGTTNPSQKLEVAGNAVFDGIIGVGTAPSAGYAIDADGTIRASYFEGTATRANSLTANGSNCLAGQYPVGIDASGNAEGCTTAATGGVTGSGAANYVARWTGTTALSIGALYDNGTNVSIGTTAPGAKLDVQGKIRISNNGDNVYSSYSGGLNYELIGTYGGWNASTVYLAGYNTANGGNASAIAFGGSGNERLYANLTTGNVGIGTTNPTDKLEINGNLKFTTSNPFISASSYFIAPGGAYFNSGTVYTEAAIQARGGIHNDTNTYLTISGGTSGNTYFSGNVGIGTTNPTERLIVANSGRSVARIQSTGANEVGLTYVSTNGSVLTSFVGAAGQVLSTSLPKEFVFNNRAGAIVFSADSSYARKDLVVATNGNVGIGTASPTSKLEVSGDAKATSFTYSSDRNLKTNIKTVNNALSKIQKLRGVTFNWKKDGSKSVGLIAQEVEQVFPELVSGTEGNKGVEYGNLVGPLIEAVKEQQKEIDRLQYRISVLEKTSVKKTK